MTPADVPARAPRFFDSPHAPSEYRAAVNRAKARDNAYIAVERLVKALAALRGAEQDLDLNLEAFNRAAARARLALDEFCRLLDEAPPVPVQHTT